MTQRGRGRGRESADRLIEKISGAADLVCSAERPNTTGWISPRCEHRRGTAPSHIRRTSARMSGMDVPLVDHNETGISPVDNGTFLRFSPTSASTSAAASSPGRPGNVYVYVWLFLGLLVFLLTLLIISLHRLKNIISSSSSVPDCSSEGGSSFTNMEICSISSQRSTISSLST